MPLSGFVRSCYYDRRSRQQASRYHRSFRGRSKTRITVIVRKEIVFMAEVTVVVPTFNCARFISNALNSVLTQSLQDFEIIIVDDGSFDDTGEIVKPYLDDRRIHYVLQ